MNRQISLRNQALCRMWLVIISMAATSMFLMVYSVLLFAFTNDHCLLFESNTTVAGVITVAARMIQYVIWVWPMVYVFWPAERRIKMFDRCRRNNDRSLSQLSPGSSSGSDQADFED